MSVQKSLKNMCEKPTSIQEKPKNLYQKPSSIEKKPQKKLVTKPYINREEKPKKTCAKNLPPSVQKT
jgi:hypothetical protein